MNWISVKDRLPERFVGLQRSDIVIVSYDNGVVNTGYYDYYCNCWFDVFEEYVFNVTHWMTLPEPPKGE